MQQPNSKKVRHALLVCAIGLLVVGMMAWRHRTPERVNGAMINPHRLTQVPSVSLAVTPKPGDGQSPVAATVLTDICGHGLIPVDLSSDESQIQFNTQLVEAKESDWILTLQNSGELRTRAAGLVLDGRHFGDRLVTSASEQARNDLIQLALGTSDPAVYGFALNMCHLYNADELVEACGQLSPARWQQLDPDNAAPWLFIAEQADMKHEQQVVASALSHAANVHSLRYYDDALSEFVSTAVPTALPEYDKYMIQRDVASYSEMLWHRPYRLLLQHCAGAALQNPNQLAVCGSIADLFIERGRDIMDYGVGVKIGEQVGWSSNRLSALRENFAAMFGGLSTADEPNAGSCASIQRLNKVLAGQIEAGQIGAARAAIRASGQSTHELATGYQSFADDMLGGLQQPSPAHPISNLLSP